MFQECHGNIRPYRIANPVNVGGRTWSVQIFITDHVDLQYAEALVREEFKLHYKDVFQNESAYKP